MFNRKVLKARAKVVLRTTYWQTFGILLLIQLIGGAVSAFFTLPTDIMSGAASRSALYIILGVRGVLSLLLLVINIFFINPLALGGNKFLLDAAKSGFTDIGAIGYSFRSNYKNIVMVVFMKTLILTAFGIIPIILLMGSYTYNLAVLGFSAFGVEYMLPADKASLDTLFTVLPVIAYILLIPAIIKMYDYYLVEYILAEDANISWRGALSKSKQLMRGNRWAVFVMNLSFFGWLLLGMCACGIGILFVLPYIRAADAQLYLELSGQSDIETFSENTENI